MIRDQMENTRTALSEKLEELETRVTAKVVDATQEVADTVETVTGSVQETVETVKDTVEETISAVKDGVSAVKRLFDVPEYVDQYPWVAVGGSVALGYLIGDYLLRRKSRRSRRSQTPLIAKETIGAPVFTNGHAADGRMGTESAAPKTPAWLQRLEPELSKLKGVAVGMVMGTVRELVTQATGEKLGHSLAEIIDSATEKLGGTPMPAEAVNLKPADTPERVAMTV